MKVRSEAGSSSDEGRVRGGGEDALSPATAATKKTVSNSRKKPAANSTANGGNTIGSRRKVEAEDGKKPKKSTVSQATELDYYLLFKTLEGLPQDHIVSLAKGLGQNNTVSSVVSLYMKHHMKNKTKDLRSDQSIRKWVDHEISRRFRKRSAPIPQMIRQDEMLVAMFHRLMEKFTEVKEHPEEQKPAEGILHGNHNTPSNENQEEEDSPRQDCDVTSKAVGATPPFPPHRPDPSTTSGKEVISKAGKAPSLPCCRQDAIHPPALPADVSFNIYAAEGGGDSSSEDEIDEETFDDGDNSPSPRAPSPLEAKSIPTRVSPTEVVPAKQPDISANTSDDVKRDDRECWTGCKSSKAAKHPDQVPKDSSLAALNPEAEDSPRQDCGVTSKAVGATPPLPPHRPDPLKTSAAKEKISKGGKSSCLPCCRQEANLPPPLPAEVSFNIYAVEGGGDSSSEDETHDETVDDVGNRDNSPSPGTTSPKAARNAKNTATRTRVSPTLAQTSPEAGWIPSESSPSKVPHRPQPTSSEGSEEEPRNRVVPTKQPDLQADAPLDKNGDGRGDWTPRYESSFAEDSSASGGRSQQARPCLKPPCRLEANLPPFGADASLDNFLDNEGEEQAVDRRDEPKKLAPSPKKKDILGTKVKKSSLIPADNQRCERKCLHESSMTKSVLNEAQIHSLLEENELLRHQLSEFLRKSEVAAVDKAPGELVTQPASKMVFNSPFHWSPPLPLKLINSSPLQILWTIKASERIAVKPDHGVLLRGMQCRIDVALTSPEVRSSEDVCLTVEWSNVEEDQIPQLAKDGLLRRRTIQIQFND